MKKLPLAILILLLIFPLVKGQEVVVTASFDTSRIWIGDQINYTVTVEQPADISLSLKPLSDSLVRNIEILAGPLSDTMLLEGGRMKYTGRYLVTSFDSGLYQIPPYYAEVITEEGIRRYHSGYSFLEVMRVKIAPQDSSARIFDIVGPYKAPVTMVEILPWLLLALAAAALIWGLIVVLRRLRKPKEFAETEADPDPAHVIAFRKLEKLRDEKHWQKGAVKLYYTLLTEILREYLDNRYGINSPEMTTSETLYALKKSGFKQDWAYGTLKNILTSADLVKFAKHMPGPAENDQYFSDSWQFVEITKQVIVENDAPVKQIETES